MSLKVTRPVLRARWLVSLALVMVTNLPAASAQAADRYDVSISVSVPVGDPREEPGGDRVSVSLSIDGAAQAVSLAVVRSGAVLAQSPQTQSPVLEFNAGTLRAVDVLSFRVNGIERSRYVWDGRPTIKGPLVAGGTSVEGLFTPGQSVTASKFGPDVRSREPGMVATSGETYRAAFTRPFAICDSVGVSTTRVTPELSEQNAREIGGGQGKDCGDAPSQPVLGRSVGVAGVSGVVRVRSKRARAFSRLTKPTVIPVGSVIDARRGRVRLTSAGRDGKLQTADFYDGKFVVTQARRPGAVTELRLTGALERCARGATASQKGKGAKVKGRRLWGDGKGNFRTKGRNGSATVRGTIWLVHDRCDRSTLFRVRRGVVRVRDTVRKRTITLRAPKSYVAGPRR